MTYTKENPPKRGMAKKAWDYFIEKYKRPIVELYYSPKCDGHRAWVCHLQTYNSDYLHSGSGYSDWWIKSVLCSQLK